MKKFKIYLSFIILVGCTIYISCHKDQLLLNEIEGRYSIESIRNYENGKPENVSVTGHIYFEKCKLKETEEGNCSGWIQFEGSERISFKYSTTKTGGYEGITIHSLSKPLSQTNLTGDFSILRHDDHALQLQGSESTFYRNGQECVRFNKISFKR